MSNSNYENSSSSHGSDPLPPRVAPRIESYSDLEPAPAAESTSLVKQVANQATRADIRRGNSVRRSLQFAEPMTPQGLLLAFKRRWKPALLIGVPVALVAMLIAWFVLPGQYSAVALLRVAAVAPRLVFKTADDPSEFPTYLKTQQALIRSRFVLNAALRRPGGTRWAA